MAEINDGGPAFPQHLIETRDGAWQCSYDAPHGAGLSLRDYFAGQALASLVTPGLPLDQWPAIATRAYFYADAMLAARSRPPVVGEP